MGPHAALADHTVRENIMTGIHFLGCKCCGTYDRHNQVVNVALNYFRYELKFSSSTSSVESNFVGTSASGKSNHTDGQVWGSPFCPKRVAFDVSIVNPTAVSHSGAGACGESLLNPNAGTRSALWQRRQKTDKYNFICHSVVWTLYRSSSPRVEGWGAVPAAILEPTLD